MLSMQNKLPQAADGPGVCGFNVPALRSSEDPRDWHRPWRDPPGFFLPNCPCCGIAASQTYHCIGGVTAGAPSTRRNTNYQYQIDTWATKATLSAAIDSMAGATPTSTGPSYKYGGISSNPPFWLTQCDSYSPDVWTAQTAMPSPGLYRHSGYALSGLCYCVAGWNSSNVAQSSNNQMTPGSPATWTSKTAVPQARANAAATYIASKGYFFCGDNSTPTQTQTTYEYDPSGNSWATKSNCPSPSRDGMACFTISGTAYIFDGGPGVASVTDAYVVDTWTAKTHPPDNASRQFVGGASFDSAGVGYITGGLLTGGATAATHQQYVPDTWASRANLPITIQNTLSLYA
jgi:hypothetical protein